MAHLAVDTITQATTTTKSHGFNTRACIIYNVLTTGPNISGRGFNSVTDYGIGLTRADFDSLASTSSNDEGTVIVSGGDNNTTNSTQAQDYDQIPELMSSTGGQVYTYAVDNDGGELGDCQTIYIVCAVGETNLTT